MLESESAAIWTEEFLGYGEMTDLQNTAFGTPTLNDAAGGASAVGMYDYFRTRPGATGLSLRGPTGDLIGFAYGYPNFQWVDHVSDWDDLLREALGANSQRIVGCWTLMSLALHPPYHGRGFGRQLLRRVIPAGTDAWLATRDANTPAQHLYQSEGWQEIGRGPLAGPSETSVVLVKARTQEPPR